MNNKSGFPVEKDGISMDNELQVLMNKYFRVPDGQGGSVFSLEAYDVGNQLHMYFVAYAAGITNQADNNIKMKLPDPAIIFAGLEAPFKLMLSNRFFQNNVQILTACILQQLAAISTSRRLPKDKVNLTYPLQLRQHSYLPVIAGLVGGLSAQKDMDLELTLLNDRSMAAAVEAMKKSTEDLKEFNK